MQEFEKSFEEFCKSPGVDSGKARSYAKAIRYLCDYMGIYIMDDDAILKIKAVESSINDKNSKFYCELLSFLHSRRQTSYLEKGYIRAAFRYFNRYFN